MLPSSPFITEVDGQSRTVNTHLLTPSHSGFRQSQTDSPYGDDCPGHQSDWQSMMDRGLNKENIPQEDIQAKKPNSTAEQLSSSLVDRKTSLAASPRHLRQPTAISPGSGTLAERAICVREPTLALPTSVTRAPSTAHGSKPTGRDPHLQQGTPTLRSSLLVAPEVDADDTCMSDFSQVPDSTLFRRLRHSPTVTAVTTQMPASEFNVTPRAVRKRRSSSTSPSPTPRKMKPQAVSPWAGDTQTFLIDFTQQIEGISRPNASISTRKTEPGLLRYVNTQRSPAKANGREARSRGEVRGTPSKQNNILHLLDFDLPPAPTPKSIPTITVRELESLKSSFLSQISSLNATLSGREAEVDSLKKAIGDAERRAAEAQQSFSEEKCRREDVEQEKFGWEQRGQELENVLRAVREEIVKSEDEKEQLKQDIGVVQRRAEDAEERSRLAEQRLTDDSKSRGAQGGASAMEVEDQARRLAATQIDAKIEAVSRELHAVYKEKHERKVMTLKKSYEARADKKVAELQTRIANLEEKNGPRQEQDIAPADTRAAQSVIQSDDFELRARTEEQKALIARLEHEMQSLREHQEQLEADLKQERIEKGDLVAAVDELLALQSEYPTSVRSHEAIGVVEDFRLSIGRAAGVRSAHETKIGKLPQALPKARGSGAAGRKDGKSLMLENIERMGRVAGTSGGCE